MTPPTGLVVTLLLLSVMAVLWPGAVAGRRLRRAAPSASVVVGHQARSVAAVRVALLTMTTRYPRHTTALVAAFVALLGWLLAGPVAAFVLGSYAGLAVRAAVRRVLARRTTAARARLLDELCALAADLRAGLPAAWTGTAAWTVPAARTGPAARGLPEPASLTTGSNTVDVSPAELRLRELTAAAWRLADRTGAPVADLVERIEAGARAADRARCSAAAQAAGARATAVLLAGLPVGGLALGYAMGTDPLYVLLHTPLGAASAGAAVALQLAGLAWCDRLARAGDPR